MATNIQTGYLLKTTWDSDVTIVDTTAGQEPDATLAAGTYMAFAFLAEEVVIAAPDAFTSGQWSVAGNTTSGQLVFTISATPNRNGSKIDKFQYALDGDQVTPTWVDLPEGTTTGTYTATGVADGTYTSTIAIRAVTSAGNGAVSDLKTATVAGAATNLLPNSTFDSSTGLTGSGWSVSGGALVFAAAGTGASCRQTPTGAPLAAGDYTWSVTVSGWTSGEFRVSFRSGGGQVTTNGADLSGDGVKGGTVSVGSAFDSLWIRIEEGPATFNVTEYSLVPA